MTKSAMDSARNYYSKFRKGLEYMSEVERGSSQPIASMQILKDCALEKGLQVEEFVDGTYELKNGSRTRFISAYLDKGPALWLCSNKYATFELLKKYGFSHVPNYRRYSLGTINEAREDFRSRNRTVVIKPSRQTYGGTGVTANIQTVKQLNKAIFRSLVYDGDFLMEDFVDGDNFRVLCYEDQVLDVVQRLPANVTGDGASSIKRLIETENEKRKDQSGPFKLHAIRIDEEVRRTLMRKGLSLDHVPAQGERVFVRTVCNHDAGDETVSVSSKVHPQVLRDCQTIIRILDVTLGGVDIITKDISKPLGEVGGVINEVNTAPGLNFHDKSVSMKLIDLLFEDRQTG